MAERTLFPRAFGLHGPTPLWTAPAFDRCMLLVLLYPIAIIVVMWAVSGHVGPGEHAFLLLPDLPGWRRSAAIGAWVLALFAFWRGLVATAKDGSARYGAGLSAAGAFAGASTFAATGAGTLITGAGTLLVTAVAVVGAVMGVVVFAGLLAFTRFRRFSGAVGVAVSISVAVVKCPSEDIASHISRLPAG